jgi:hypothetical protein
MVKLTDLQPFSCSHMQYCSLAATPAVVEASFVKTIMTHYALRESKVRHTARLTKMTGGWVGGGRGDRDRKSNHFDGPAVNRQFITLANIILQGRNGASKYTLQPGMGLDWGGGGVKSSFMLSLINQTCDITNRSSNSTQHGTPWKTSRSKHFHLVRHPKFHHRVHNSWSLAYNHRTIHATKTHTHICGLVFLENPF